jgi:hypothetical protein
MARVSVKGAARDALRADVRERKAAGISNVIPIGPRMPPDGTALAGVDGKTQDSFINFAQQLGIGADNSLTTATYGFNPITRQRTLLEWIHRGSWLGGVAIDVKADDMTRGGVDFVSEMEPDASEKIQTAVARMRIWEETNEVIKWARLYGGAVGVMLVDGQDFRTPLNYDVIGPKQFKGLLALDRWMLEPTLEDLVTDLGPNLGKPKYYRVGSNAPALRGIAVHYSRLAFRIVGVELPYQQRLTENLWGLSVLERLYDRMIAFDQASTGAAQLVAKAYLRTLSVKSLRELVSSGGPALRGLVAYTEMMRRYQGIEGITLIDADDTFEAQSHTAFSGLSDALMQFAQQLSGALQIPLTRLFGQSPAGLNATGDNDMRNYYDHIKQLQENDLHDGIVKVYKATAMSEGIPIPPNFALEFKSLWQLTDVDKATISKTTTETVLSAKEAGLVSDQIALKELRQSSRTTGIWTNVTAEDIEAADDVAQEPMGVDPMTGEPIPPDGKDDEGGSPFGKKDDDDGEGDDDGPPGAGSQEKVSGDDPEVRPQGTQGSVGKSSPRGGQVPKQATSSSKAGTGDRQGVRARHRIKG